MTKRADLFVRQSGAALVALLSLVAMVLGVVVIDWTLVQANAQSALLRQEQADYLRSVDTALSQWYGINAHNIDATDAAPDVLKALRDSGIRVRWNLQVAASGRLTRDGVRYRVIAIWLPRDSEDTSRFDSASGALTVTPGTTSRVINGLNVQMMAIAETRTRLQRIAERLEAYARAQYLIDPARDNTKNHFRAGDCAAPRIDELPCVDRYEVFSATGMMGKIGVDARLINTAWGSAVEWSNGVDSQTTEPPYSMALRAALPWGGFIRVNAIQPI